MTNPETVLENETQNKELENLSQPGLEVGTQVVAASEVAARSATYN